MYAYTELLNKFNRGSINKTEYKLENNTWCIKDYKDNKFYIQLHGSIIATITQDKIILDNNGYFTYTTKDRLNKILDDNNIPFHIYQMHFKWYIWNYQDKHFTSDKVKFYNGITFIYESSPLMDVGWRLSTE